MGTVQTLIDAARYDLLDFEEGIQFDNTELLHYLNRMVGIMDSTLASLNSDIVHGTENNINAVASQNYVDLIEMNGGYWDSIRSVWIGSDRLYKIPLDLLMYKRKFISAEAQPQFYAVDGRTIKFECDSDSSYSTLVIHYNKKHRPLVRTQSFTFTVDSTTDIFTAAQAHGWMQTDGPVTVSNSGGALPTGLVASTNYYIIRLSNLTYYMSESLSGADDETYMDIVDDGSGTHTVSQTDITPYSGIYDEFLREMLVMCARAKKQGILEQTDGVFHEKFRARAMQETVRRGYSPKTYSIDF